MVLLLRSLKSNRQTTGFHQHHIKNINLNLMNVRLPRENPQDNDPESLANLIESWLFLQG